MILIARRYLAARRLFPTRLCLRTLTVSINRWKFVLGKFAAVTLAVAVAGAPRGRTDRAIRPSRHPTMASNADNDGNPTYKVSEDGTVDWYTFSGFRRYHSDCHVCHGPMARDRAMRPALAIR